MHQMCVLHLQGWLLPHLSILMFLHANIKGLGQQESTAQKAPHVSASQWQITVPSSKQRIWRRTIALFSHFFENRLKRAVQESDKQTLVLASYYRHAMCWPLSNTALCDMVDVTTNANSPGAPSRTDTSWACTHRCTHTNIPTKRNHKWLNSILQHSLAILVLNTRPYNKVNRGDSIGYWMHQRSIMAACLHKPRSEHGSTHNNTL